MAEIRVMIEGGRAIVDLAGGEIRESVELEATDEVPALESIVLHFDFYGRLARIELDETALPPGLLDS
jgi:hypothetical protein